MIKEIQVFAGQLLKNGMYIHANEIDKRRTYLVNLFVVFVLSLSTVLLVVNLYFHNYNTAIINSVTVLTVCIPVYYLNHRGYIQGASVYFILLCMLFTGMASLIAFNEGRYTETENVLFLGCVISIIMLDGWRMNAIYVLNCLVIIALKFTKGFFSVDFSGAVLTMTLINVLVICVGIYFFMTMFKNISVHALRRSEASQKELGKALRNRDKLFSIVAHDIISPLNLFQNVLAVQDEDIISKEKFMEYQDSLRGRLKILNGTIENLLVWARNQQKELRANPKKTSLDELIMEDLLLYDRLIKRKDLKVDYDFANFRVWMDPDHLKIIIRNLIHNALKFTPTGKSVYIHSTDGVNHIEFYIRDEGTGISEGKLDEILKHKIGMSNPGTEGELGTGLGMSLVLELLDKNNCKYDIQSEPGMGTTVKIWFPIIHHSFFEYGQSHIEVVRN